MPSRREKLGFGALLAADLALFVGVTAFLVREGAGLTTAMQAGSGVAVLLNVCVTMVFAVGIVRNLHEQAKIRRGDYE